MQAGAALDGRYRLIEQLGVGGFGQVWKAYDPKVDRLVAVKILTGDGGRDVARFAREASVAGGLSHPNIVTVHDFGSSRYDGQPLAYMVMELLDGEPLSAQLVPGPLALQEALRIAVCIGDALQAAHDAGLVHRDIKPSNVMVLPATAKVVDFGITKGSDVRHDITATGVLIGTPAYMAPECFSGNFEFRSDLYSMGCVLFEMVTGRRPFDGTSWHLVHQHLHEQPVRLRSLRPDVPPELDDLVARLLAKDPSDRPACGQEVADILEGIGEQDFGTPSPIRGRDLTSEVTLSRDEAAIGAIIPLRRTARRTCPECAAALIGKHGPGGCRSCDGGGQIRESHTMRVRFPAGVRDGQQTRMKGLGAPGMHGGEPGDLFVTVHVEL
ncbi:serine/threonine protein kinase [Streptomyces viridochromogenes]|uniref:non-specific serine/threonine protein kinase n=1 Tax=Streptomyces viridochromogenes TaxID=1938 RepID=A0A0J8C8I5_STRVR|nr:serine/threonine protein kinase [Streptomyces viridochromogenes]